MTPRAGLGGRQNSEAHTATPLPQAAGQGWPGLAAGGGARHVWPSGGTGGTRPGEKRSWRWEDVVSAPVAPGLAGDTVCCRGLLGPPRQWKCGGEGVTRCLPGQPLTEARPGHLALGAPSWSPRTLAPPIRAPSVPHSLSSVWLVHLPTPQPTAGPGGVSPPSSTPSPKTAHRGKARSGAGTVLRPPGPAGDCPACGDCQPPLPCVCLGQPLCSRQYLVSPGQRS